jgi:hypothetical protein
MYQYIVQPDENQSAEPQHLSRKVFLLDSNASALIAEIQIITLSYALSATLPANPGKMMQVEGISKRGATLP